MTDLARLREARIEIARKAADRYRARSAQRAEIKRNLKSGGPAAADTAEAVASYMERRPMMLAKAVIIGSRPGALERIIDAVDFTDAPASEPERVAGRPVARIVQIHGPGFEPTGFGTGFMIAPRLLMTNHHVFESASDARGCGAHFGYERVGGALGRGELFECDPDAFFASDAALDYAVVAIKPVGVEGAALDRWGRHALLAETGKILVGQPINIIQHPDGGPKKYASTENEVIDRLDDFLHYRTDTRPGSSGSPGFNAVWEVVVLHHSGVPAMKGDVILNDDGKPWTEEQGEEAIDWIANEGVRVSRIVASLTGLTIDDPAKAELRDSVLRAAEDERTDAAAAASAGAAIALAPAAAAGGRGGCSPVVHVHGSATINICTTAAAGPAGPAGDGAAERAIAAVLEKKLRFDPEYGRRRGYDPHFLTGFEVPLPTVASKRARELVKDRHRNPLILDYHHYSLVMNKKWLLQMWSAANVDYSPEVRWDIARKAFGEDTWIADPRISAALQIEDPELYAPARKFDRGHVVRREDTAWGATREEVEFANSDTFHWTNCTPQHEAFNRSNMSGLWGRLENHVTEQAEADGDRLVLFAGPVLDGRRAIPHDFGGGRFNVPLEFWKVVVIAVKGTGGDRLRSYGFFMEQEKVIDSKGLEALRPEERFDVGPFKPQQRSLAEIETATGLIFPEIVRKADVLGGAKAKEPQRVSLPSLEAIRL